MTDSAIDRPRLVVSTDGSLAAVAEGERVTVVELPAAAPVTELNVDAEDGFEIAWLGSPPRLLILSRHASHSTALLLDPRGPHTIAEIELVAPVSMFASVGAHALVIGTQGAAVLTAGDSHLTPYQFPARARPTVAGAAANQFVVALPGVIEEWDPHSRVPKRRLRLPRPAQITAVGGSERVVWMVTQQQPTRVDVLPLINRGQPKLHDLPEPITAVSGHPKSDLIACLGGARAYAIDLDGRTRLRSLAFPRLDRIEAVALVIGRTPGVLAAQRGRPLAFTLFDTRDAHAQAIVVPELTPDPPPPPVEEFPPMDTGPSRTSLADAWRSRSNPSISLAAMADASTPSAAPTIPIGVAPPASTASTASSTTATTATSPPMSTTKPTKNLAARFAAVRQRREQSAPIAAPVAGPVAAPVAAPAVSSMPGDPHAMLVRDARDTRDMPARDTRDMPARDTRDMPVHEARETRDMRAREVPAPDMPARATRDLRGAARAVTSEIEAPSGWREQLVSWAREVMAGDPASEPQAPPSAPSIELVARRFELGAEVVPAIALVYGAHLAGCDGVAPIDVARVVGGWGEALGSGELAASGVATFIRSRVRLAAPVQRALDELSPMTGTLVGVPQENLLLHACLVVATDRHAAAARHVARVGGAILVGHEDRACAEVVSEARAFGAVAMVSIAAWDGDGRNPMLVVAPDEAATRRIDLPRFD